MKLADRKRTITALCKLFGKTPQAFYKGTKGRDKKKVKEDMIISFVKNERKYQPMIGVVKLQHMINQSELGVTIGRDALYNLLREHRLLIRKPRKYRPKQTDGNGKSIYPDLRKGLVLSNINQLWVTDITYVELANSQRFCYLCCICDEASHMIVGYSVSLRIRTEDILEALQIAVNTQLHNQAKSFNNNLILHSDRGSQFKSKLYRSFTDKYGIILSMCKAGHSHENPIAERLNGILKNELLVGQKFKSLDQAKAAIAQAIRIYNQRRPHLSCNLLTPEEAHNTTTTWPLKKLWKQRARFKQSTLTSN